MTVREIMTSEPQCCTPDTRLQEVARMMSDCDCGAIPVVENLDGRRPIGIITDRDIVVRVVATGEDCRGTRAEQAMSSSTVTVHPDQEIHEAAAALQENRIRRIVVDDDDGRCVGILAQADVARHQDERETGHLVEAISGQVAVA